MPYSLSYDRDCDCVVVVFENRVDLNVIREAAPKVARLCEETGCRRILNDMSNAIIDISIAQIPESPRIMDESQIARATKRALVLPRGFSEAHFLETVTRNRGHNLRVFFDVKKARAWLRGDAQGPERYLDNAESPAAQKCEGI